MNGTQNPQVQHLLSQLADIKGLDRISWWPLAPGWWAIIMLLAILVAAGIAFALRRAAYRRSWQHDTYKTLTFMADQVEAVNAREILIKLSALLRRIAIRRYSRAECAGLKGNEWVQWLTKHDPERFNWAEHASILTEMPYAPPISMPSLEKVKSMINATKKWVQ